ncbi:MAG: hypothetical protein WC517_04480 [Patescibacteria group bacterium]
MAEKKVDEPFDGLRFVVYKKGLVNGSRFIPCKEDFEILVVMARSMESAHHRATVDYFIFPECSHTNNAFGQPRVVRSLESLTNIIDKLKKKHGDMVIRCRCVFD